jgi:hypothetical protein
MNFIDERNFDVNIQYQGEELSWLGDINFMHEKFGINEVVKKFSPELLKEFLLFRIRFLEEELQEMKDAESAEDVVDALIDLVVVAIGTLDSFQVDGQVAWDAVLEANLSKNAGSNPTRPNAFGLPDLIKPEGWQGPSHKGNHGLLAKVKYPLK